MFNLKKSIVLIGLMAVLSGCVSLPFSDTSSRNYQRGWVSMEDEQFFVRGCRETEPRVIDQTPGQLERLFRQRDVTTPLYVEWIGEPRLPGQPIQITQLRYVASDPSSCQAHLNDVLMHAQGERPDWQMSITDSHIRIFLPQQRRTLVFPAGSVMRQGADWWWESDIEGRNRKHRLSLRIQPAACQDDQAWFGLSVLMTLDGREYIGCAKRGNLERLDLFTEYRLAETIETRDIRVKLGDDGSALLSEDYLNQQPALESRGSWQQLSSGRLLVTLDDPDPKLNQEALMFVLTEQGILLPGFHPRYGHNGLHLKPSGIPMPWAAGRLVVP